MSMTEANLTELNLQEFTLALASSAAVPGGGGASALAGAVCAALGHMVGALTVGKKKYECYRADLERLMQEAEELRVGLLACIRQDAEAFEPLSKAYGIPKDNPERETMMEQCLRNAMQPPLQIMRLCADMIRLQKEFAEKGSVLVISDAATGAAIGRGALYGAAMNVKINTKAMKDRAYADSIDREVDRLMKEYGAMADEIFFSVFGGGK